MNFKRLYTGLMAVILAGACIRCFGQASVGSMAEFRKKQDDGIAETVRMSQDRTRTTRLVMGVTQENGLQGRKRAGKSGAAAQQPERPSVIRIGVHSSQTGHDNRRQNNVR